MRKLLLGLMVLLWADFAPASTLTICNQHDSRLYKINMIYNNAYLKPLQQSWKVYGWMDVPPGRCQGIVQHPSGVEAFLSVRYKTSYGKTYIAHYAFGEDSSTTKTAERFFCVRDDPHDRVLKTLDAHELCPVGWYLQLFNLYVNVPHTSNFTLRLGTSKSPQ